MANPATTPPVGAVAAARSPGGSGASSKGGGPPAAASRGGGPLGAACSSGGGPAAASGGGWAAGSLILHCGLLLSCRWIWRATQLIDPPLPRAVGPRRCWVAGAGAPRLPGPSAVHRSPLQPSSHGMRGCMGRACCAAGPCCSRGRRQRRQVLDRACHILDICQQQRLSAPWPARRSPAPTPLAKAAGASLVCPKGAPSCRSANVPACFPAAPAPGAAWQRPAAARSCLGLRFLPDDAHTKNVL